MLGISIRQINVVSHTGCRCANARHWAALVSKVQQGSRVLIVDDVVT
jgi:hypoxanthine phosphoribosyltransferase